MKELGEGPYAFILCRDRECHLNVGYRGIQVPLQSAEEAKREAATHESNHTGHEVVVVYKEQLLGPIRSEIGKEAYALTGIEI